MTKKPSAKESRQKTEFPDCVIASRQPVGRRFWAMPESAASRWLTAISALVIIVGCEGICDQVKCLVGRQRSRISEDPQIPWRGDWRLGYCRRRVRLSEFRLQAVGEEQSRQFAVIEAEQFQIDRFILEGSEFGTQHVFVPTSHRRQLVVSDHQGAALRFRQMSQNNDGNCVHVEPARRQHPCVPGDDRIVRADQNRVDKAEFADTGGDLVDLRPGMGPGIVVEFPKPIGGKLLDALNHCRNAGLASCAWGRRLLAKRVE